MALFLGLDAGGTKTECAVAEDGRELARRTAGTVKLMNVGGEEATMRLHALVRETLAIAGSEPGAVRGCCFGLAGSSSPEVRTWANAALESLLPNASLLVTGDEEIALEAAFPGAAGVLVIAGTGSHIIGRCSDGTRMTSGGYGPVLGDEGSGYWIGREALRAALQARDRGVQSSLLRQISEQWATPNLGELIAIANNRIRPNFGELAEGVARCAERGDTIAAAVLERAGEELAAQVSLVVDRMHGTGCRPSDVEQLAYTGSVLTHIAPVRHSLAERLRLTQPEMHLSREPVDALSGALWRARQLDDLVGPSLSRLRSLRL